MRVELIIGILCITIIVITGLALGYNGAMASGGFALIGALLGWQGKKQLDKKGGNIEAMAAALRKAGYTENSVIEIAAKIKGGKK